MAATTPRSRRPSPVMSQEQREMLQAIQGLTEEAPLEAQINKVQREYGSGGAPVSDSKINELAKNMGQEGQEKREEGDEWFRQDRRANPSKGPKLRTGAEIVARKG